MTTRAKSLVSISAALALGAGSLCWSQDQPDRANQRQQAAESDRAGQPAQGARGAGQDDPQRQAAWRQWHEQIQQIIQQGGPTAPDKLFVLHAAMECKFATRLSEIAGEKSQNAQVKQIAQRIAQGHQQMQQELQQVAKQVDVQIPQTEPMQENGLVELFNSLAGDQFDQRYVAFLNASHAGGVAAFEAEARIAQAAPVKEFALQQLPKLREHYQQVQQTAAALGVIAPGEAVPAGGRIRGGAGGEASGGK